MNGSPQTHNEGKPVKPLERNNLHDTVIIIHCRTFSDELPSEVPGVHLVHLIVPEIRIPVEKSKEQIMFTVLFPLQIIHHRIQGRRIVLIDGRIKTRTDIDHCIQGISEDQDTGYHPPDCKNPAVFYIDVQKGQYDPYRTKYFQELSCFGLVSSVIIQHF